MYGIRDGYHLGIPIIGKFHRLQGAHRISGEADANHGILFINTDHLFKSFRNTCCFKQYYIPPDHVQVKVHKFRQRLTAPDAHDIDCLRLQNNIHRRLKCCRIKFVNRILQLFHVGLQHRCQYLRLCAPAILGSDLLHRIDLILHPVFQISLKFRISVITDKHRIPHDCRLADTHRVTQFGRGHKYRLIIVIVYKSRYCFLSLTHLTVMLVDSCDNIISILYCHSLLKISPSIKN